MFLCASILLTAAAANATPPEPKAFVEEQIEHFSKILERTDKARFETLKTEVEKVFDFDGFAKQALSGHWEKATPEQKKRFEGVVQRLVESVYLQKPKKVFSKHKVEVQKAKVKGTKASVEGIVAREDVDVSVVVKLEQRGDSWIATDVVVDELSLLEDYQHQFRTYLDKNKHTIDELIAKLEEKTKENEAKRAKS